jgi:hypothetical protein
VDGNVISACSVEKQCATTLDENFYIDRVDERNSGVNE